LYLVLQLFLYLILLLLLVLILPLILLITKYCFLDFAVALGVDFAFDLAKY